MKKDNSFEEDIVKEVISDFKNRQQERKQFESKWQLNINFFMGNLGRICCHLHKKMVQ